MQSKIERIREHCRATAKKVEDANSALKLCYIVHGRGQFAEAMALIEPDVAMHPAAESAMVILNKFKDQDVSSFLGMAAARKGIFLGLGRRDVYLALININADEFGSSDAALHEIQHMAWQAMDLMDVCAKPEHKSKKKLGPMIPKRSPYNRAGASLKADTFAATLSGLQGKKDSVREIASRRAIDALSPTAKIHVEDHPFMVAMEPAQGAFEVLTDGHVGKGRIMKESRRLAAEVSQIVDQSGIGIEQWWSFAKPAQDMAWRGFSREDILGAAVNTSEDAYIRAIGYMIADVTGIAPSSAVTLLGNYNAFTSMEQNSRLHKDIARNVFEDLMTISIRDENCEMMLLTAHQQNEALPGGNIIGWCAAGLHAAARAFDSALRNGARPEPLARQEFLKTSEEMDWARLSRLGEQIVDRKREGYVMTLSQVAEISETLGDLSALVSSVKQTMADEGYLRRLKAANELTHMPHRGLEPAMPARSLGVRYQPTLAAAPSAPALGGSSSHAAMRQKVLMQQKARDEDKR